jgi:hypothetical protein
MDAVTQFEVSEEYARVKSSMISHLFGSARWRSKPPCFKVYSRRRKI